MRHLLHGRLDVIIREIDTLPSLNEWNFNLCCKELYLHITGWSVYTEITLIRDPMKPRTRITLGELPKMKAEEGVKVLMLVWDDRTSVLDFKKNGLMAAHDQETADYFKNKKVNCVLCPRNPDDGKSIVQGFETSTIQVAGAATGQQGQKRTILSFVGGIDLCDGRYDIQEHPLFSTLDTMHKDDFHQPNFSGASIKKEGSVAWDVLLNFQQRWEKQVGNQLLFSSSKLDEYFVPRSTVATTNENETWNVQLFRSIDGGAASGFPQDPEDAAELGLVSGKDNITGRSIHDAYINAIRRAKNFIYTENHFVRSSHGWQAYEIVIDIGKNSSPTLIKDKIKIEYISERQVSF
ncbi:hypothetical protein JHK87_009134 [Glycine soja]|nr:hypothetical protein JHK87_009134 [Glycine soja]